MAGKVLLVGAGPGNAGLLTLRGKAALESAEVVLYDRLVGPEIRGMIPDSATQIDVGKRAGNHTIPQHEINALLLEHARAGKTVVRLKGGDSYLFGRGAEELEAVLAEGIPFEVVPGVTSAVAVPAFAGIPVSHRDFASSVHIITAHRKDGAGPEIDYGALCRLKGTLIFLMGLGTMEEVLKGLTVAGMPAATPAALIENGTRPNQRKKLSTVGEIADVAKQERFAPPSVLVVGGVCGLSGELDWFSRLPLSGVKIITTRPSGKGELTSQLRALGAEVLDLPCIKTKPEEIPQALFPELARYGWIIFTSPTGAKLFFDALATRKIDIRTLHGVRFAAVGAKTAAVVESRGIIVDFVPETYNSKALAQDLPLGENNRVLLFRARQGAADLPLALEARGFTVDDLPAYDTLYASDAAFDIAGAQIAAFTSASAVRGFVASTPGVTYSGLAAACIGAETAAEAQKNGFSVLVSEAATIESLVALITAYSKS